MSFLRFLLASTLVLGSQAAFAMAITEETEKEPLNLLAIAMFVLFVILTLAITRWAAKRTTSAAQFYAAGGGITGFQNGLAIAGDYMSAASFLGISGLVYKSGYDGLIYSVGFLIGWPIVTFLIAEPLRNLGRFTFADVASFRFAQTPIRVLAASGTLVTVAFYLIAQMIGAGQLIKLIFGLDYQFAVVIVGVLMILYVTFGGMVATTWVQIIKACLLLFGASFMAFAVMRHFNFSAEAMFREAVFNHPNGEKIMAPGTLISDPISAISLGLGLMFGTAGLPHILMRFFTVRDAQAARKSVFYATGLIGYFYILTFIIGFGAITLVATDGEFLDPALLAAGKSVIEATRGGTNMTALDLAKAVGGDVFFGFISAVAFATILAVVSGLTLAGASAISHDLYATVVKKGKAVERNELLVSKLATIALGVLAIALGIAAERLNVAFAVGLAFAVAASCNFPVLLCSIYWRGMTTRGAVVGGFLGLAAAVIGVVLSPGIWVEVLNYPKGSAPFPYANPALFSMTLAFVGIFIGSKLDRSARGEVDRAGFDAQFVRGQTGIGAGEAASH